MPAEQARALTMTFPTDLASHEWFLALGDFLSELPNCQVSPGKITLTSLNPAGALPALELHQGPVAFPQLSFDLAQPLHLEIDNFLVSSQPIYSETTPEPEPFAPFQRIDDSLGFYLRLEGEADFKDLITLDQFTHRLKGHLTRVDHFGVNLPARKVKRAEWDNLLSRIAAQANLYRYPEDFEWPFIIPATPAEFESDISAFVKGREPRFELVYDEYNTFPYNQFALETDLTPPELEALFPPPYGSSIPDLAELFRSVFVFNPWPGLGMRFDLYFKNTDEEPNDWVTGQWLVQEGGRIRS